MMTEKVLQVTRTKRKRRDLRFKKRINFKEREDSENISIFQDIENSKFDFITPMSNPIVDANNNLKENPKKFNFNFDFLAPNKITETQPKKTELSDNENVFLFHDKKQLRNKLFFQKEDNVNKVIEFIPFFERIKSLQLVNTKFYRTTLHSLSKVNLKNEKEQMEMIEKLFKMKVTEQTLVNLFNNEYDTNFNDTARKVLLDRTLEYVITSKMLEAFEIILPKIEITSEINKNIMVRVLNVFKSQDLAMVLLSDKRIKDFVAVDNNKSLLIAVRKGYVKVAKKLLSFHDVNGLHNNCEVIKMALKKTRVEILEHMWKMDEKEYKKSLKDVNQKENILKLFRQAYLEGNFFIVNIILNNKAVDPSEHGNMALRVVCHEGHAKIVERLLKCPKVNPKYENSIAFKDACKQNHHEVVAVFLKDGRINPKELTDTFYKCCQMGSYRIVNVFIEDGRINPAISNNQAIRFACYYGHFEVVRVLLNDNRVDPSDCNNLALRNAAEKGNTDIIKLLLTHPKVDPSDCGNDAIRKAHELGRRETFRFLRSLKAVKKKLKEYPLRIVKDTKFVRKKKQKRDKKETNGENK